MAIKLWIWQAVEPDLILETKNGKQELSELLI